MSSTLSDLIQSLSSLKGEKKALESEVKAVDKRIEQVEGLIFAELDAQGVTETKSAIGKVAISESTYPQVQEWDAFGEFILDNRYLHLLERRPAVLAYRELLNLGKSVPGVLPFTKRKLNYREN